MDEKLYGILNKHDEWQTHLVETQCNQILRQSDRDLGMWNLKDLEQDKERC